jgi:hypothetical protein
VATATHGSGVRNGNLATAVATSAEIALLYERHADFVGLVERLDPRGAFRNAWLEAHVLGRSGSPAA